MTVIKVIILAVVQGLTELLPVSSSAHVVVAEKVMGLDPSSPPMTLLLVMLHTGTMFAVIAYFWKTWKQTSFHSRSNFRSFFVNGAWATFLTAFVGYPIILVIEKTMFKGMRNAEIENLFGRLDIVGAAMLAGGVFILVAGLRNARKSIVPATSEVGMGSVSFRQAGWIGAVQGICLPFRGFSRSGATISMGLLAGTRCDCAEHFSFALAVILTPPVVARELWRLVKASHQTAGPSQSIHLSSSLVFALLGAVFAFLAGLLALKWLSSWLERGKWYLFGIYCLVASGVVFYLHHIGY
jgi:undecaprenyl-diphosphatase